MGKFEDVLAAKKEKVWPVVEPYLNDPKYPSLFDIPDKYKGVQFKHWDMVREYPERKGKYVRPTLLLLTAEGMGAREDIALQTAAAMQVSEDWLLIHDDLEDDSNFRRGKLTLHKMYGEKLAINAGDALHMIMWKILLDNKKILDDKTLWKVVDEFYTMLSRTVLGQGGEIMWSVDQKRTWNDEDWFFIADGKTSYYTIAGPMRLGAIIAGANQHQLNLLSKFGRLLGRCYQLVDDVLDLTGNFKGLKGKIQFNDIYESKRTLILSHLLRNLSKRDVKRVRSFLSKSRNEKTKSEVLHIVDMMKEYGSIEYARKTSKKIIGEVVNMFNEELRFISKQPARDNLETGISFILNREY